MVNKANNNKDIAGAGSDLPDSATEEQEDEDGLDMVGVDLLYQMDVEDITALRNYFFPKSAGEKWLRENRQGLSLNKVEFINAMDKLAGSCVLSLCAAKLFDTLDMDGSGLLQWEELLDAIIEKTRVTRSELEQHFQPVDSSYSMACITHCREEPIVKIVPLETETTFCYAIVSKFGRVGVYDGQFKLLDSYRLGMKPQEEAVRDFNEFNSEESEERPRRRSVSTFLTDAIFISDTYALVFASSDRSLHLYDATGLVHVPLCHIIGMPNVSTCLAYHRSAGGKPGLLFLGDDKGDVTVMRFHQARNTLLKKKHPDKLDVFYWMELSAQSEYVTYRTHRRVHSSSVIQITFCPDNDTAISCSRDPARTLIIRHIDDKREPYIFKLQCGVRCFHLDRHLHKLVTGSNDSVVRIWNPVVTQRPLVLLSGHHSPVIDIRVLRFMTSIFSYELNGVLKIWSIPDEYCIMTLSLEFPAYKILGKNIIYGARTIFPGPLRAQEVPIDNPSIRSSNRQEQAVINSASGSNNLGDILTDTSANAITSDDREWQRDSVLVACCDHVATVQINTDLIPTLAAVEEPEQLASILPPPTKEHYASVPSPWRVAETTQPSSTPRGSIGSKSTKSTDSSSTSLPLKGKEAVAAAAPVKDMHTRRTQHRIKQQQMQMLVEQGAPHLALDLHPLEPIRFSRPLPITLRMKEKGVDVSDPDKLLRIRMQRDSLSKGIGLGGQSSGSSVKSSKSSKSVPTVMRRRTRTRTRTRTGTSTGRLTPDWFSDALHTTQQGSPHDHQPQ